MKIALDPYMYRHLPIPKMVDKVAELGYNYIELSPRDDFMPFYKYPRVDKARIKEFKKALSDTGVQLSSLLPMQHWAGPDEEDREAAVRNWKRVIEIAVEMDVQVLNTEFTGHNDKPYKCEQMFMRSMEELIPLFEKEGLEIHIQAHPFDFIERNNDAVDLIRGFDKDWLGYFYAVPHTFFYDDGKGDIAAMLDYAGDKLKHINIADTYNHKASSCLRYVVNPPGVHATVHQHLDIGKGDIDWDVLFSKLRELKFDGIVTAAVFGEEHRADESSRFMLKRITEELVDKNVGVVVE
ncbi:sugar phosphate isomerase/epimerase [Halalkalibacterium halodurans]|jgi:myo-inositol catabolism protein IolH|uniref:Myo-inositol catabolism n=1 Tax=Halalkalibacterium halodurans (strain ATCC BAA-125 / DSM 18197 / FERM 7344 / JCM 9153 / C-125) TaxID=272558 RepID=Q9KAH7_HALH5|nr:sugar phosphate isomerase/epimerase [Halalkalibacterium halodurans]MDY7222862.1 sugar phosphate isomerase/epimerase [Halalkalibacterium halodurans]MDY7242083.1 sugar phosphate isomerase/epimerase [Halalkalibacterium halodurans]MED3648546.1 sugar phosphate isomerase/epimerase [Halalkalibacterium halodurans]MED4080907.1 sugar phosphate isomerase/epimerase [Halalkalibacterium halodurans]MED4085090.1 sugar phosphate isomerase/epimerase [Halalkalibacterium halodurans]